MSWCVLEITQGTSSSPSCCRHNCGRGKTTPYGAPHSQQSRRRVGWMEEVCKEVFPRIPHRVLTRQKSSIGYGSRDWMKAQDEAKGGRLSAQDLGFPSSKRQCPSGSPTKTTSVSTSMRPRMKPPRLTSFARRRRRCTKWLSWKSVMPMKVLRRVHKPFTMPSTTSGLR